MTGPGSGRWTGSVTQGCAPTPTTVPSARRLAPRRRPRRLRILWRSRPPGLRRPVSQPSGTRPGPRVGPRWQGAVPVESDGPCRQAARLR
jgi:hypothetical protein